MLVRGKIRRTDKFLEDGDPPDGLVPQNVLKFVRDFLIFLEPLQGFVVEPKHDDLFDDDIVVLADLGFRQIRLC